MSSSNETDVEEGLRTPSMQNDGADDRDAEELFAADADSELVKVNDESESPSVKEDTLTETDDTNAIIGLEQIHDDDHDIGPDSLPAAMVANLEKSDVVKRITSQTRPEHIEDDTIGISLPMTVAQISATYGDADDVIKRTLKKESQNDTVNTNMNMLRRIDSIVYPTREEIEDEVEFNMNDSNGNPIHSNTDMFIDEGERTSSTSRKMTTFRAKLHGGGRNDNHDDQISIASNLLTLRIKGGHFSTVGWNGTNENDESEGGGLQQQQFAVLRCVIIPTSDEMKMEGKYYKNKKNNNSTGIADGQPIIVNQQEINDANPVMPEGFLVEDDIVDVVEAEPLLPFWRQKGIVVGLCCLVTVAVAIAVFITLSMTSDVPYEPQSFVIVSMAPSISLAPSASPTACFEVEIAVELFHNSTRTEWKLLRINDFADEVASYAGDDNDLCELFCVPEGKYEFTIIFDSEDAKGDMCCGGQYNITTNGQLMVQGNDAWQHYLAVTARFFVPDMPSPSSSEGPSTVLP